MLEKLKILEKKFNEISDLIIKPDVIADQKKYIKISKEYKDLKEIIDKKNEYENVLKNIDEANHIIKNENVADYIVNFVQKKIEHLCCYALPAVSAATCPAHFFGMEFSIPDFAFFAQVENLLFWK